MNGFNSSPTAPLYAAANYQSIVIPLIWSGALTQYNLVITVLSMFIMLVKALLLALHILYPIISVFVHALEVGLWAYSVYGQTSPDTLDPQHINNGPPWYITKSCSVAHDQSNVGFCKQAKASFYVAVFMLVIFSIHLIISIYSIFSPPPAESVEEEVIFPSEGKSHQEVERQWEMVPIPPTPGTTGGLKSPTTPRTRAFNNLEGGGPGGPGGPAPSSAWTIKREGLPWTQR